MNIIHIINYLKKVPELCVLPIMRNATFFIFTFLLGLICIVSEPWNGSRFWSVFNLFSDLYIFCALLLFLPARLRRIVRTIAIILIYTVSVIDVALFVRFGAPIIPLFLQMALQSNIHESTEAITTYLNINMLASPLGLVIFVIIGHWLMRNYKWKELKGKVLYCSGIFVGLFFVLSLIFSFDNKEYLYYRIVRMKSEIEAQTIKDMSPKTKWYVPLVRLSCAIVEVVNLKSTIDELHKNVNLGKIDSCKHTSPDIVLIIGESYNRSHSGLYGYRLNTTPVQDSLKKEGSLVDFTDAICSWNATCETFQNILSMHCVGDGREWYNTPFFTSLMRKSGYKVFFMSNQFVDNPASSFSAFIEDIFINDPLVSKVQFDYRNNDVHQYDDNLLEDYDRLKKHAGKNNLWIFHFMGLHADFSERYPSNKTVFTLKDYHRKDLSADDIQLLSEYDNAVRYNDEVLGKILKRFKDKEAIIIFFADHGERVYDYDAEFGRSLGWSKSEVIQQFYVPMWMYATKKYSEKHSDIWERVKKASEKRYMTDAIGHTILYLAGAKSKLYKPKYDVLSSDYDEWRKRIIRDERDFDELVR